MSLIPRLSPYSYIFPNPLDASQEGLVAYGGDLHPQRVLAAYKRGIFPWYNEGDPILWWSPDPRLVLYPQDIKISRSLKKSLKKFEVRVDTNFRGVITSCKDIRSETWILPEIVEGIVDKFIEELNQQLDNKGIWLELTPAAKKYLAKKGYSEELGARPLARVISEEIKTPLTNEILFGKLKHGGKVLVDATEDKLSFSFK